MHARVRQQHCHDRERRPPVDRVDVDDVEEDQEGQGPELREEAEDGQVREHLRQVGEEEHGQDVAHLRGDHEEVGLEGAEAQLFEGEGEVLRGCCWKYMLESFVFVLNVYTSWKEDIFRDRDILIGVWKFNPRRYRGQRS